MARLVGSCPSCEHALAVRRLACPSCGVTVEGDFELGPLAKLNREQLGFVEVFLRARGKIKDVEGELGISYPTVVSRLDDVLVALGFAGGEDPRQRERREQVLDNLSGGRLSATAAAEKLRELGEVE